MRPLIFFPTKWSLTQNEYEIYMFHITLTVNTPIFTKKYVFGLKWAWNILISRYITIKGQRELKLNMTPKPNNLMVWPVHMFTVKKEWTSEKRMNTLFSLSPALAGKTRDHFVHCCCYLSWKLVKLNGL